MFKFIIALITSIVFLSPLYSAADVLLKRKKNNRPELSCTNGPSPIKRQSDLYLVFGSYYLEEDHTLEIISRNPLEVEVYFDALKGDHPEVIEKHVKSGVITNIYRVFAFTNLDKVTITSSAREFRFVKGNNGFLRKEHVKLLTSPVYTITKTREQALADLREYTNARSFDDLFETHQVCMFSSIAKEFLYDDQGGIGITEFFNQIQE